MLNLELLRSMSGIFRSQETLNTARLQEQAFTRDRKMPFTDALCFLPDMRKSTLQTRLNAFFRHNGDKEPMSQQAFSKLRANFDHSPFEKALRVLVKKEYSGDYDLPLWAGYHLIGVDGSYIQLPRVEQLRRES